MTSILLFAVYLFPLSEILLLIFKRTKQSSSINVDRGSLRLLWFVIIVSVSGSIILQWYPMAILPFSREWQEGIAFVLLCMGYLIRWISIISLGRLFTVDVAIQKNHQLLQHGLYKHILHPSYTGLLIEFLGLAIFFGTWICVAIIMIPITTAVLNRVRHEEIALIEAFGEQYKVYAARTKRFIPGII